jgi:hypothetical protein
VALLDEREVIDLAETLYGDQVKERQDLDVLRRYETGRQAIPLVIPADAPAEIREMARISRINLISIVIRSLVESLYVDNFRAKTDAAQTVPELTEDDLAAGVTPPADDDPLAPIWRAWQLNRFDREQSGLYRAVYTYGYGYVVALPGRPVPVARAVSPRKMIAMYGDDEDEFPEYALQRRRSGFRVLDAEGVYELRRSQDGKWSFAGDPREHGLGYCPVVRYTASTDLDGDDEPEPHGLASGRSNENLCLTTAGEVAPLMTLQDQLDVSTFTLKGAEWYSAYRQRWAIGWTPENRAQKVKAGASQLWTFDEDPEAMRLGEFAETSLDGFLRSREATLKYAATLSQTPVHELIGELVNLSAEALAAAEAGRDRKVMLGKTGLGEGHEQLVNVLADLMGVEIPEDVETVWRDTSARAFGAIVDGLGKLAAQLQIPPQMLWDRIPGVTRQDVQRWQAAAAEGDAMDRLTGMLDRQASAADPTALPPAGQPGETVRASGLILPPGAGA